MRSRIHPPLKQRGGAVLESETSTRKKIANLGIAVPDINAHVSSCRPSKIESLASPTVTFPPVSLAEDDPRLLSHAAGVGEITIGADQPAKQDKQREHDDAPGPRKPRQIRMPRTPRPPNKRSGVGFGSGIVLVS